MDRAVAAGRLLRLRVGAYCAADVPTDIADAARLGGRLTCLSLLALLKIFVLDAHGLHVHLVPTASRIKRTARPIRHHWQTLCRRPHPRALTVEIVDALVHAVLCQSPRASVATLDSALHLGFVRLDDLDEIFAALPRRYRAIRKLLDPSAEAGSESLMRLILRSLNCTFIAQAKIPGVGRVDFLVDGWLIIECDSKAFHSTWEDQLKDRRRDQEAAIRGYATYRPVAEDIMWHGDVVRRAAAGLLDSR